MFQAGTTIGTHLSQAIAENDKELGEGYAERHLALIAECVLAQTMDYNSVALIAELYEMHDALDARHDG